MTNEELEERLTEKLTKAFTKEIAKLDEKFTKKFEQQKKNLNDHMEINNRQHAEMVDLIERRFQELKNENAKRADETEVLKILSKMNQEQHLKYDELLGTNIH